MDFPLIEQTEREARSDAEVATATRLVRQVLPHVSDCDGLSIMVERLPTEDVQAILAARERALAAGLDLVRWAAEVRERAPSVPAEG